MENLQNKRPLYDGAELGGGKRQKTESVHPGTSTKAATGAEWDYAKKKVQEVYGREFVCFAYLINGTCKCPPSSHFSHPEDQRGAFSVKFSGTPPPAAGASSRDSASSEVSFTSTTSSKPRLLKGQEWEDGVARVKERFGSDFVCFSYLINGSCKCAPDGRYKHPEGLAGKFGVCYPKDKSYRGASTTSSSFQPGHHSYYSVLTGIQPKPATPMQTPSYFRGSPLTVSVPSRHLPYHHVTSHLAGPATPARRKVRKNKLLVGEQWEEAMERVREHFGDDFVCFSYLINGSCRCDGAQKFPHPPGLAGSFGVLLLEENTKCFDFNVNGRCLKKRCPSIHEYYTLDEAITRMRVSQCLGTLSKKKFSEQCLKPLRALPTSTIDVTAKDSQETVTKLQTALLEVKKLLSSVTESENDEGDRTPSTPKSTTSLSSLSVGDRKGETW